MMYVGPARNANELNEALQLAANTFFSNLPEKDRLAHKALLMFGNPKIHPEDIIVLVCRTGCVAGSVVLVDRIMPLGEVMLPVTHVTSVCITEDMRGKGLSKPLMSAALIECKKRGAAMALLVARRSVDHFYNQFGFWGLSAYSQIMFQGSPQAASSIRLQNATKGDQEFCAASYNNTYKSIFGHQQRDILDWDFLMTKLKHTNVTFTIIKFENQVLGYLMAAGKRVFEISIDRPELAVDALNTYAALSSTPSLDLDITRAHPIASELMRPSVVCTRECRYGGHMGAIVDQQQLIQATKARVCKRAKSNKQPPTRELVDGIEYAWDGRDVDVSIHSNFRDFRSTARLFGAEQLSMRHQPSILDPLSPFNLLFSDQV